MTFFRFFSPMFQRRYLQVHSQHATEAVIIINIVLVDFVLILCCILIQLATLIPLMREGSEEQVIAQVTLLCVCVCEA
jgi:hypothetical protein